MAAKECARCLLGSYRVGDAHDPEVYIAQVVRVLEQYPVEVMREVSAKLPEESKWLPTIAEVKSACERCWAPMRWAIQWEQDARRQMENRTPLAIEDGRPPLTYQQIKAKFAEVGIHIGPKAAAPVDVKAFREKWKISDAQWAAIPDAPGRP